MGSGVFYQRFKDVISAFSRDIGRVVVHHEKVFEPRFHVSPALLRMLMSIEADRQHVDALPVDVSLLASLRESARLAATHHSTQIEGNRLTLAQVADAIGGARFPGRERDEREVRNYYRALEALEALMTKPGPIRQDDLQRLHGWVMKGRALRSPYREGQNVIRDTASGHVVYLPPEAADVPQLMDELFTWLNGELGFTDHGAREWPVPIVAALVHYQFATIHPYFDGNGRTARLLTTLVLHRAGYGLKGIYSLDAYYAQNLSRYYDALAIGGSHNYYFGRADAEVTPFVTYFCEGMAEAFAAVRMQAARAALQGARDQSSLLRSLDPRQRRLLELFRAQGSASSAEIAAHLGLSTRTVPALCRAWVDAGFLALQDPSRKNRAYRLGQAYEAVILA